MNRVLTWAAALMWAVFALAIAAMMPRQIGREPSVVPGAARIEVRLLRADGAQTTYYFREPVRLDVREVKP